MIYVCSDIHGHYDTYAALLTHIDLKSDDTLYILGDVIDRGPDGVKILQDMMTRQNIVPILGNHEFTAAICLPGLLKEITKQSLSDLNETCLEAIQEWLINGGGPTLLALNHLPKEERVDILDYLCEMDLYAEVDAGGRSFVLTHAGLDHFDPDKPLGDYELADFLFYRPTPNAQFYPDRYLIYGHTPTHLLRYQLGIAPTDGIFYQGTQIAIDCGCGYDGQLGCLCLDTLEEFYVNVNGRTDSLSQ